MLTFAAVIDIDLKQDYMKRIVFALALAAILNACSTNVKQEKSDITAYNEEQSLPGDSTLYGLACEGCTDSVLVYIPFAGGDPDTLDILNARANRKVFGRPDIGDEIAIVLNGTDKKTADLVINLERLKGEWCYLVTPKLRPRAGASPNEATTLPPNFPDSLKKLWFEPREYGMELQQDHIARPIGIRHQTADRQDTPVEYPDVKRYREWHIFNGHLLLSEMRVDTLGKQQVTAIDTADIVLLRRDTLLLRFNEEEQGYYRKTKE